MKLTLVSLSTPRRNTIPKGNIEIVLSILKASINSDLLIFPGWTLDSYKSLELVIKKNSNLITTFVLEIGCGLHEKADPESKAGFYVVKGKTIILSAIKQVFSSSAEANRDKNNLIKQYLNDLHESRSFSVNEKCVRLVICGENNVLANNQINHNEPYLRSADKGCNDLFNEIHKHTDIYINPAHTPMGNLGKMKRRWSFLSSDGRLAVFTTNELVEARCNPNFSKKSLQYIFIDGKEVKGEEGITNRYKLVNVDTRTNHDY